MIDHDHPVVRLLGGTDVLYRVILIKWTRAHSVLQRVGILMLADRNDTQSLSVALHGIILTGVLVIVSKTGIVYPALTQGIYRILRALDAIVKHVVIAQAAKINAERL